MFYLLSSQNKLTSVGGIASTVKLLLDNFPDIIKIENTNIFLLAFCILKFRKHKFIIIGYSDKIVFLSLILFILNKKNIIYIPCFHPWYTMRRKFLARLYELSVFKYFLKAKLVVCLSVFEMDYFVKLNKEGRYKLIYLPSNLSLNNSSVANKNCILFVGRDDLNKNVDSFVEISRQLRIPNDHFISIVSNTDRSFPVDIVHYKTLDHDELITLYNKTLALFVTSEWESLSLVGVEAIISGAKLVCNKNVMLGNLASRFPTLILNDYSDINLVNKFLDIKINPEEYADFSNLYSSVNFRKNFSEALFFTI